MTLQAIREFAYTLQGNKSIIDGGSNRIEDFVVDLVGGALHETLEPVRSQDFFQTLRTAHKRQNLPQVTAMDKMQEVHKAVGNLCWAAERLVASDRSRFANAIAS